MKTSIDLNYKVEIDSLQKDNLVVYDINIVNDFTNISEKGVCTIEEYSKFLSFPNKTNLNALGKDFTYNDNIIFMRKSLLKDLQNGKVRLDNVIRDFDNYHMIQQSSKYVIVIQERDNVKEIKDINDTIDIELLKDFEILNVDLKNELLMNLQGECVYFQPVFYFDLGLYYKIKGDERPYSEDDLMSKIKKLKLMNHKSYSGVSSKYFIKDAFSKENFNEAFQLAKDLNKINHEFMSLMLLSLRNKNQDEDFFFNKELFNQNNKFKDLESVLLKIKIDKNNIVNNTSVKNSVKRAKI